MNLSGHRRDQFPSVTEHTYLMTASAGAPPVLGAERLKEYAEHWLHTDWEAIGPSIMRRVGDKIAALIGAEADTISFHMNSTLACAVAMSCVEPSPQRNKIVFTEGCFTSQAYLCMQQERIGAEVVIVPLRDGIGPDMDELLSAIDERTLFVPVSHVFFRNGYVLDAEAVCQRAHEVGAYVVLDVYQSVGVLPVRCEKWGVDFAIGGCAKWLCGGSGTGFLYVRPDLAKQWVPKLTGAMAHARAAGFDIHSFEPTGGALRFQNGGYYMAGLFACEPGLDIIGELGIGAIRANSLRMTDRLIAGAKARGFPLSTPEEPERRGGAVSLVIPGDQALADALRKENIYVDFRVGAGIRVSPHFYNTDADVDRFFDAVDALLPSMRANT